MCVVKMTFMMWKSKLCVSCTAACQILGKFYIWTVIKCRHVTLGNVVIERHFALQLRMCMIDRPLYWMWLGLLFIQKRNNLIINGVLTCTSIITLLLNTNKVLNYHASILGPNFWWIKTYVWWIKTKQSVTEWISYAWHVKALSWSVYSCKFSTNLVFLQSKHFDGTFKILPLVIHISLT